MSTHGAAVCACVSTAALVLALVGMAATWYSITGQNDFGSFSIAVASITAGFILMVASGIVAIREGYS